MSELKAAWGTRAAGSHAAVRSALATVVLPIGTASHAASNFATGPSGTLTTSVNLNFSITIPGFVFLRVGSAASVNTLSYAPTAAQIVNSTGVLATGGDTGAGNSDVTVQVIGNGGSSITLTALTGAASLISGANSIPWTTLTATSPTGSIAAPPFNSGSTVLTPSGGVVNQRDRGEHLDQPANTVYASGTYTRHRDVHRRDAMIRRRP